MSKSYKNLGIKTNIEDVIDILERIKNFNQKKRIITFAMTKNIQPIITEARRNFRTKSKTRTKVIYGSLTRSAVFDRGNGKFLAYVGAKKSLKAGALAHVVDQGRGSANNRIYKKTGRAYSGGTGTQSGNKFFEDISNKYAGKARRISDDELVKAFESYLDSLFKSIKKAGKQ